MKLIKNTLLSFMLGVTYVAASAPTTPQAQLSFIARTQQTLSEAQRSVGARIESLITLEPDLSGDMRLPQMWEKTIFQAIQLGVDVSAVIKKMSSDTPLAQNKFIQDLQAHYEKLNAVWLKEAIDQKALSEKLSEKQLSGVLKLVGNGKYELCLTSQSNLDVLQAISLTMRDAIVSLHLDLGGQGLQFSYDHLLAFGKLNRLTLEGGGEEAIVKLLDYIAFKNAQSIQSLTIRQGQIGAFPTNLERFVGLRCLAVVKSSLSSTPQKFGTWPLLEELDLSGNVRLMGLSESVTDLENLKVLNLSGSSICRMPKGTEKLLGRKIKIDLSRTKLLPATTTIIADQFGRMVRIIPGIGLGQAEIYGALDAVNSQQRAELMMGDIQPYEVDIKEQKRMAEHFANGHNTHTTEVSKSVNASIERLQQQYKTDLDKTDYQDFIQGFLKELPTFGVEDKVQTNVKALINCALGNPSNSDLAIIGTFARSFYGYNSAYNLPFLKLFQMVFYAFADTRKEGNLDGKVLNEKDKQSRIQDFLKLVYQGTIEFGTTGQHYRGAACPGGMTNYLVGALQGVHPASIIATSPKQLRVMQVNHSIKDALKGLGLKESGYQTLFDSVSSLMDSDVLKLDQRLLDYIAQQNLQEAKTLMGKYDNVQDLLTAYLKAASDGAETLQSISKEISGLQHKETDLKEHRVSRQWLFDTMQLCRAEREYRSDKDFDVPLIDEVMPVFDASTGELEKHFRQGAIRVAVREFFKTKISPTLRQEIANEKDQKYTDEQRAERLQTKIGEFIQTITVQTLKPGQDLVGQLYTAVKTEVERTFKDDNVHTPLAQLLPQVILQMMKNLGEKSLLRRL